uniref:Nucleotide-diphospho-sugar transferase domain-containing protein n=1 Tax=Ditylenchus dipsaci TaxID=166011 RepID=A0A915EVR2_9BILA
MLREEFLKEHLAPTLLPTLYISAIPLRSQEVTISKVFYPDSVNEDKQVNIVDLKERSWYYLCVEWENFNRHNETTGTDCRIYRTLDRLRSVVDFPIRISTSLVGGVQVAVPPAQVFQISDNADLDVVFPFLRQQKDYGRLCILEEPLVNGYTAMGRLISGLSMHKCYFNNLKTKDYELSISDSEASAYKRSAASPLTKRSWLLLLVCAPVFVIRKIYLGYNAMQYVQQCGSQVKYQKIVDSKQFQVMSKELNEIEPMLVLILNQHALNMTLNWLCNTKNMKNVHASVLIVTLDKVADRELAKAWPTINRLNWVVTCLQHPFNYGDGQYQLFYLFRANLARALLHLKKSFWMVQQDTFWNRNLLHLNTSNSPDQTPPDIYFDRAAEGSNAKLCAGGYYLVRPQPGAHLFFQKLSASLEHRYVPDNTYMTSLCSFLPIQCGYIPFTAITNWIWLHEPGFYFLEKDGRSCNLAAVNVAKKLVEHRNGSMSQAWSYSHWQFGLYQAIIDWCYMWEGTEWLLNAVIFPYAHYFMITL